MTITNTDTVFASKANIKILDDIARNYFKSMPDDPAFSKKVPQVYFLTNSEVNKLSRYLKEMTRRHMSGTEASTLPKLIGNKIREHVPISDGQAMTLNLMMAIANTPDKERTTLSRAFIAAQMRASEINKKRWQSHTREEHVDQKAQFEALKQNQAAMITKESVAKHIKESIRGGKDYRSPL